jgi:hypothetical protein
MALELHRTVCVLGSYGSLSLTTHVCMYMYSTVAVAAFFFINSPSWPALSQPRKLLPQQSVFLSSLRGRCFFLFVYYHLAGIARKEVLLNRRSPSCHVVTRALRCAPFLFFIFQQQCALGQQERATANDCSVKYV